VLVEREIPLAEPGPGEVGIRVLAAGVNLADLFMRVGIYGTVPPRPFSPGFEIAGEITRVGPGVEGWREGQRVVALLRYGGYARDVVVSERQVFRCPESLAPADAAAIPVAFLTAHVCLIELGNARPGEVALILNAGGGVGTAAVQLAVRRGLRVIGTAGDPRKRRYVTEQLGAEACVDSRSDFEEPVRNLVGPRGVDLALDGVGGRATAQCRRLLAPLGRLVFYGLTEALPRRPLSLLRAARAWLRTPRFHPLSLVEPCIGVLGVHLLHLGSKEEILRPALDDIFRAALAGEIHPVLDRTFPLDGAGAVAAHRYLHERRNLGKVVLAAADTAR
jgi:NADPH:quinone reductase-like Zn-dependent oxidoreductase